MSTQPRTYTTGRQRTCREHDVTTLPPISISRQHRACVTSLSGLYCCGYSSCVHRSLRSVFYHLYLAPLLLCVTDPRSLWAEMYGSFELNEYLKCINISDVLCFSPETHPRNLKTLDNMQRTPTLQPRLPAQAAAGHTTSVWQVRGVLLWLIALSEAAIRHQSSPPLCLSLCCACVCGVSRISRAPRQIRPWVFGNMVK